MVKATKVKHGIKLLGKVRFLSFPICMFMVPEQDTRKAESAQQP